MFVLETGEGLEEWLNHRGEGNVEELVLDWRAEAKGVLKEKVDVLGHHLKGADEDSVLLGKGDLEGVEIFAGQLQVHSEGQSGLRL